MDQVLHPVSECVREGLRCETKPVAFLVLIVNWRDIGVLPLLEMMVIIALPLRPRRTKEDVITATRTGIRKARNKVES